MLSMLQSMLKEGRRFVIGSEPFRDESVSVQAIGATEHALVERYDAYNAYEKTWHGYWYLIIRFKANRLVDIERSWSPGPK